LFILIFKSMINLLEPTLVRSLSFQVIIMIIFKKLLIVIFYLAIAAWEKSFWIPNSSKPKTSKR
jgi:hypothetical protein